jgi:hypothetical protein
MQSAHSAHLECGEVGRDSGRRKIGAGVDEGKSRRILACRTTRRMPANHGGGSTKQREACSRRVT